VREFGPGGWMTATKYIEDAPGNWEDDKVKVLLDVAEETVKQSISTFRLRGRVIRKKRSVGLIPTAIQSIPREALDEAVLAAQENLDKHTEVKLPFCAFNGGSDMVSNDILKFCIAALVSFISQLNCNLYQCSGLM
jgi:IMP and pyridine-specific 5'-nucleotidase